MATSPKSRRRSSLSRGRIPPLSYKMESPPSLCFCPSRAPPAPHAPHRLFLSPALPPTWSCCRRRWHRHSPDNKAILFCQPRCRRLRRNVPPHHLSSVTRHHPAALHRFPRTQHRAPAVLGFAETPAALPSSSRSSSGQPFHSTSPASVNGTTTFASRAGRPRSSRFAKPRRVHRAPSLASPMSALPASPRGSSRCTTTVIGIAALISTSLTAVPSPPLSLLPPPPSLSGHSPLRCRSCPLPCFA